MFDIGFWELALVAVVALLVVGPKRLPKIAYETGLWVGRIQRYLRNARFEIERELHNYEVQQALREQAKQLDEIKNTVDDAGRDLKQSVDNLVQKKPDGNPASSGKIDTHD